MRAAICNVEFELVRHGPLLPPRVFFSFLFFLLINHQKFIIGMPVYRCETIEKRGEEKKRQPGFTP